ncbi:MAG TPA: tetratricopeptide repeat protein, partial [Lacibacter sp.]|nr:tetratricopeptide repeat protein [Lacibacter sp.]
LEKVLELSRPEEVIHEAMGYCYDKLGQLAQARFHYRKASHLNPEDSKLYYKIACTYLNEGQFESAIKQLNQALKMNRLQPDYNLVMGMALVELKQYEKAVEHFSLVIKARPRSVKGWQAMLDCMLVSGHLDHGLEYADAAYAATGQKPVFLFYRTAVLFATGQTKQALTALEQAMMQAPRLIKKLAELHPKILQHPQVVDLVARYKRSRSL